MANEWHYAVVVGVDQYPRINGGDFDLKCPIDDAEQIKEWLISSGGGDVHPDRVKVLTRLLPAGRNPPVPVFDEINEAIIECTEDFKRRREQKFSKQADQKEAWKQSRFYFYISGHGVDGEGDDAVLITANASLISLNHISTRSVLNKLKTSRAFADLVVWADCCRDLPTVTIQDLPWDLGERGYNIPKMPRSFIAYAARNRKKAYEPNGGSSKNSIFTQVLLEGLKGGVPGKHVDSDNLRKFMLDCVPRRALELTDVEQHPEINADTGILFGKPVIKDYLVKLTPRAGSVFESLPSVDILDMDNATIRSRRTFLADSDGVFIGRLETGFYGVVPPGGNPLQDGSPVQPIGVFGKDTNETIG